MPNKASAKKALRQSEKRAVLNLRKKRAYKDAIKQTLKAVESGAGEDAKKFALVAQKALDKAAKAGTIKANTAARRLSRLMKRVNAVK